MFFEIKHFLNTWKTWWGKKCVGFFGLGFVDYLYYKFFMLEIQIWDHFIWSLPLCWSFFSFETCIKFNLLLRLWMGIFSGLSLIYVVKVKLVKVWSSFFILAVLQIYRTTRMKCQVLNTPCLPLVLKYIDEKLVSSSIFQKLSPIKLK